MFYELMMRKKEQIMYATIKGTLTENDGVFSGFSASNYLALQQNFAPEGSWEVCFKVKMGSNVSLAKYFFGSTSYGIVLGNTDTPSGAFKVFLSSNGTSWDIGNLSTGINNPADSIRYVKIGFTGEKYYIEQSEDGITYIGRAELNSTKKIYSVPVRIGNSYESSNRYWQGAIDLPNSYIKLGSTKYKLQAVVGYTVVGSPTITDGVISGFDVSNYLQVPTDFNNNDFEILLKLEDVGTELLARTIMRLKNADVTIGLTGQNALSLTGISGLIFNSGFNTNGILYVKFIQKGLNCSFGYSNDGTTYTMLNTTLTEAISYVSPNRIMQSGNWGSIPVKLHIKDSYIKINNKLWFNGQQA